MKASDVKRALAHVPDDTEVLVEREHIRLAPPSSALLRALMIHWTLRQFAERDRERFREVFCGSREPGAST